jgi:hypothetical protein
MWGKDISLLKWKAWVSFKAHSNQPSLSSTHSLQPTVVKGLEASNTRHSVPVCITEGPQPTDSKKVKTDASTHRRSTRL